MAKNQAAATAALAAQTGGADSTDPQQGESNKAGDTSGDTQIVQADADGTDQEQVQRKDAGIAKLTQQQQTTQKRVRARVLVDGRFGSVNDVVAVDGETLDGATGELCAHPASVAYALSLK